MEIVERGHKVDLVDSIAEPELLVGVEPGSDSDLDGFYQVLTLLMLVKLVVQRRLQDLIVKLEIDTQLKLLIAYQHLD